MIRTTLIALGAALSLAAQAAPVTYSFGGTVDDTPAGDPLSGQVSFDDTSFDLLSLSFSFLGHQYSLADADPGSAAVGLDFNNVFAGIDAVFSGLDSLALVSGFGAPYFVVSTANGATSTGSLSYTQVTVPEPASVSLVMGGLLAAAALRRRRAQ